MAASPSPLFNLLGIFKFFLTLNMECFHSRKQNNRCHFQFLKPLLLLQGAQLLSFIDFSAIHQSDLASTFSLLPFHIFVVLRTLCHILP